MASVQAAGVAAVDAWQGGMTKSHESRLDGPSHLLVDSSVLAVLSEFRHPDESDPAQEVTRLFLGLTPGRLEALRQAAAAGDGQALRDLAHTLKGSAGSVGARAIEAIAEQIEGIATIGTHAGALRLVDQLAVLFLKTRPILEELADTA